jgi:predicted MFS family arabinose efflux permease
VNVPIGLLAILLTALYVPESRAERPRRLDPVGQVLVIVGLASLTFAIIEGPNAGWISAQTLGVFALAVACLTALVPYELHRREPLLEMRFFRSAPFSGASAIAVLTFAGIGGFLFLNTLYLQEVRRFSPLHAGLLLLPMAAMIFVFAPISGRIVGNRGPRLPIITASFALLIASLLLTGITPTTAILYLLGAYVLFGIGNGLVNPPITNTAVTGMPAAQAGVASAVASTSRQVGMTLGVAVIGAVAGGSLTGGIEKSFAADTHVGWWIIVGLAVGIGVIGAVTTSGWAERTARRTAERLEHREPHPAYRRRAREPASELS